MVQTAFSKGGEPESNGRGSPQLPITRALQAGARPGARTLPQLALCSGAFQAGPGAFTPSFCNCTKEALGKRGLPWKHLKAGCGRGRSEAGPQCEQLSYPNMSPNCLNVSDLQQCPSLSRTHLQRTRPSGQPLPKSLPTFSGSGLCPASSKAQFRLDTSPTGPGGLSFLLPRFSTFRPERTGPTPWHTPVSPT